MAVNICLVCDENYKSCMCVTIASIACNTTSPIKFFILHKELSGGTQKIIKNWVDSKFKHCSIEFCDIAEILKNAGIKQIGPFDSLVFGRYYFADCFPNVKKVVYIDADTVILDDIEALYDINLDNFTIGAVKEYWLNDETFSPKINESIKILNLSSEHVYFASGVLLINCDKWRKENITNKLFELYSKYRDISQYPDQDPLNKLFENNYLQLPPVFNMSNSTIAYMRSKNISNVEDGIVIYHFSGIEKPWNKIMKNNRFFDWWFYAQKTPFYSALENDMIEKSKFGKEFGKELCFVKITSKLALRYLKYRLLSKILWGKRKNHYKRKVWMYHNLKAGELN